MFTWLRKLITTVVLLSLSCLAFATPPLESGVVVRDDVPYANWWYDAEKDLSTYFGVDMYVWCFTIDEADFDVVPWMEVFMRTDGEDVLRFKNHFKGDLQTSVWPGFVPPLAACTQVWNGFGGPIASGWSRFKWNDNDVIPQLNPDRRNMNTFGFNANGNLIDSVTGETLRFMMYVHAAWDGIDGASFRSIIKTKLK